MRIKKNEAELCGRIQRKLKNIDVSVVQTMMRGVRTKIHKIADNGPLAVNAKTVFEPHNNVLLKKNHCLHSLNTNVPYVR
jgi:hypothetical protein